MSGSDDGHHGESRDDPPGGSGDGAVGTNVDLPSDDDPIDRWIDLVWGVLPLVTLVALVLGTGASVLALVGGGLSEGPASAVGALVGVLAWFALLVVASRWEDGRSDAAS